MESLVTVQYYQYIYGQMTFNNDTKIIQWKTRCIHAVFSQSDARKIGYPNTQKIHLDS